MQSGSKSIAMLGAMIAAASVGAGGPGTKDYTPRMALGLRTARQEKVSRQKYQVPNKTRRGVRRRQTRGRH